MTERERREVAEQLGREPTVPFTVVARCPEGHPLVIRNATRDADGTPFPNTYWLTCPAAVRAVSRLESAGAIRELNRGYDADPTQVDRAHQAYAAEREAMEPGAGTWGGVGGTARGIKCLHAHYAYHLAGGGDPVGEWTAEQVETYHPAPPEPPIAAIDQGTNSTRLLVALPQSDGSLRDLARDMIITRLGEGVDTHGHISDAALMRTQLVLERYVRRARALGASRMSVAATSAVRDASDSGRFQAVVLRVTDAPLQILSGEGEAELSFAGAVRSLPGIEPPFLVMDIGGGSTEFVIGTEVPTASISADMGSVRLTERHVHTDPPSVDDLAALTGDVDTFLDRAEAAVPVREASTLVAVAGTATTMAAMSMDLPEYDPDRIHGTRLSVQEARRVRDRLARMTTPERRALPFMAPGREDVIVAGASILVRAMERFGFAEAVVSEHDILDGLAFRMLEIQ